MTGKVVWLTSSSILGGARENKIIIGWLKNMMGVLMEDMMGSWSSARNTVSFVSDICYLWVVTYTFGMLLNYHGLKKT